MPRKINEGGVTKHRTKLNQQLKPLKTILTVQIAYVQLQYRIYSVTKQLIRKFYYIC